MFAKSLERAADLPQSASLKSLAKLATETYGNLERGFRDQIVALERQLGRMHTALDSVDQGVCVFDEEARLVLCNRRYCEIYGIERQALKPGMTLREVADLRPAASDAGAAAASEGATADAEGASDDRLDNGRTVRVARQPLSAGGWVETHNETDAGADGRLIADVRISLQTLIDWVPDHLWVKDRDSRFVVANKALVLDTGLASIEEVVGLSDFDLHAPRLAQKYRAVEKEIMATGKPKVDFEEFVVDRHGTGKWLSSTKVPLFDQNGEAIGLIGIGRDVTARKRAEVLRDGQARILEMIAMSVPLGDVLDNLMCLVESQLNGIFGSVLLMDEDGVHLRHGAAPSLAEDYVKLIDGIAIGPEVGSCGTAAHRREPVVVADIMTDPLWDRFRHLAAPYGYSSCWSTPVLSRNAEVLGVFAMYSMSVREPSSPEIKLIDFTTRIAGIAMERKIAADRISFMANHDVLTALPNRALLEDRLSQAVLYAKRYDRRVAVAFVDLDKFKLVNDTLGHKAGDELLKTVASRMTGCTRATDTVIRLGGDEFVVILTDLPESDEVAAEALKKIRDAIGAPMLIGDQILTVTASMGVATYPRDGATPETLLVNADAAMYRAKELGRDNFQVYVPEFNARQQDRLALREELRGALANCEFAILYQPQLDLRTGRITAVEALLRWMHPKHGVVMPSDFIGLAEETGMIVPIGDWVLHEACRQNKAWQQAGLPPIVVCVNVSARQFQDMNLLKRVKSALDDSGLEGRFLELEVTESMVMQDVGHAVTTMNELQYLGVQISIDDFGTGYSSLSALKAFPVARLKIDRAFINDLTDSENDQALTSAMISLGRKLHLKVIAEGVETEDQLAFLRKHDCDEMQGYHFSEPVAAANIEAMLAAAEYAPKTAARA